MDSKIQIYNELHTNWRSGIYYGGNCMLEFLKQLETQRREDFKKRQEKQQEDFKRLHDSIERQE